MRYIDIDDLVLPANWNARATAAAAKVALGGDPDVDSQVWRDLKDGLGDLSNDKCWYCETPIPRSDNAVDHFRPKGRCSDAATTHNGYRWLAFEKTNYRYSCTFCNSRRKDVSHGTVGGKADRFPLLNEANRLYAPGPLHQEEPALLDPCALDDWELLGCRQEDGSPCASSNDPIVEQRVRASIEVCHLDHEPTCKLRHPLVVKLLSEVAQAKRFFPLSKTDPAMRHEFYEVAKRIKKSIDRKSPFSGELIFILKGQRHTDHPWIQKILES
ncbi:hypothetical protein E4633_20275 [Geomonas terrae]|uniref:TIGR02646 family protein n=1 Tax=Geomonas terrae TaxID=2562681 RepID=A0A4S1CAI6_9BACT|nr:hypothetical protein [Geomonas terrae]TGU69930.1 hypothetical protein E4633_20275 [Geomonas terrae]